MAKGALYQVVRNLSEAMVEGRLDVRGETAALSAGDAEMVGLINNMIDALVAPMRVAGNALDEIAHGKLPPFVIDDYQGEYNLIKQNINTLLAILYGMHGETVHLIGSVREGKLKTRGNDWDYQGIWKEMIGGVNEALDAVIAPIQEAGVVLDRLAACDLRARMTGRYRGEHAAIRKAMNKTAEVLHQSIAQVSDTVRLVSEVGENIARVSESVADGAEAQSSQLYETSATLTALSESASRSAEKTRSAHESAKQAAAAVLSAKESMNRMVGSMGDISGAADSTASIVNEIDGIANETGALARSAVEKAARMRISAGGFGVVAQEIRKLSKQCTDTAKAMKQFEEKMDAENIEGFSELIANLLSVARFSNLLGVNAAIEAAHVEGAGDEFKVMTDEIHSLATRSADAAKKTATLTASSASLSKGGVVMSKEIHQQLEGAATGAEAIREFSDEISGIVNEQTVALEQISMTAAEITKVTELNAASAAESMRAAKNLAEEVGKLSQLVGQFAY